MHPLFGTPGRVLGYLACWAAVAVLLCYIAAASGMAWGEAAAVLSPACLAYAFICLSPWYIGRTLPAETTGLAKLTVIVAAGAAAGGGLFVAAAQASAALLVRYSALAGLDVRLRSRLALLFGMGLLLYLVSAGLHYAALGVDRSRLSERRAAEARTLAREAELESLRMQLNPHFLFNSLHSIAALAGQDTARTREMCLKLAGFLRSSLRLGAQESIPLDEEVGLAMSYLEVERVRFGKRLAIEQDIEPESGQCAVPALVLQPLVENAVKHGIAGLVDGGTIRLAARRAGGGVEIAIQNGFDPEAKAPHKTGLGLDHVRRRLEVRYGGSAVVHAAPAGDVYRVVLRLPCESPIASSSRA